MIDTVRLSAVASLTTNLFRRDIVRPKLLDSLKFLLTGTEQNAQKLLGGYVKERVDKRTACV